MCPRGLLPSYAVQHAVACTYIHAVLYYTQTVHSCRGLQCHATPSNWLETSWKVSPAWDTCYSISTAPSCSAATPEPEPQGVSIQQLPQDGRPNFIVILTDDQGWDDIGLHHPEEPGSRPNFVNTPNLDKFLLTSKQFDNFYVAPMCSQSRAALLTGRDYPHTGTMLVNGGDTG